MPGELQLHTKQNPFSLKEIIVIVIQNRNQGRSKYVKLGRGARHFEGTFSVRKRRHFLKIKWAFLCLLQNLGRIRAPRAPGPNVCDRNLGHTLRQNRELTNVSDETFVHKNSSLVVGTLFNETYLRKQHVGAGMCHTRCI